MKYHRFRPWAVLTLSLLLCLSLVACGGGQDGGDSQGSAGKLDPPKKNQPITFTPEAQLSLDTLQMKRGQEAFAAAILAERETGDSSSLSALLNDWNPGFSAQWPFVLEIPAEYTVGDCGELYCVVPLDRTCTFKVRQVTWNTEGNGLVPIFGDTVYRASSGQPFLLYVTHGDWPEEKNVCVEVTEEDGSTWTWIPSYGEGCIYNNPPDENGNGRILDFTHLDEFADVPSVSYGDWLPTTDFILGNSVWSSDNGWTMWLSYDEDAAQGSGGVVIYEPLEDEGESFLSRYCHGTWWMEDDCLYLDVYNDRGDMVGGAFPVLMSPSSGEQLLIMQAADGSVPPFFVAGQTQAVLTFSVLP